MARLEITPSLVACETAEKERWILLPNSNRMHGEGWSALAKRNEVTQWARAGPCLNTGVESIRLSEATGEDGRTASLAFSGAKLESRATAFYTGCCYAIPIRGFIPFVLTSHMCRLHINRNSFKQELPA